jgi:hypothetical protein
MKKTFKHVIFLLVIIILLCIITLLNVDKNLFAATGCSAQDPSLPCGYQLCPSGDDCINDSDPNCQSCKGDICCRILRCNCGTSSSPCWRGSIWYSDCTSLCNALGSDCPPACIPSCGSCSSGTYYSPQPNNYYPSGSRTCKKSNCSTYTQTCYSQCPSGETCASEGYVDSCPSDETCVPRTISWSVPHPDCTSSISCQYICPKATCTSYEDESGTDWYDTCPTGSTCRSASLNVPIEGEPDDCPHYENDKTCFTTNQSPSPTPPNDETTTNVEIVPASEITGVQAQSTNLLTKLVNKIKAQETGWDEIWKYSTNQHSGRYSTNPQDAGLNNPVGLKASYTDSDGQQDIVALYIWWNPSTTKNFPTPVKIANNNSQTNSNDNWGFLVARQYNQTWEQAQIYVPYIEGTTKTWKSLGNIEGTHAIKGPNLEDEGIVQVSNITVINSTEDSNKVDLEVVLRFLNTTTNQYNIWSQANDYVGFTALLEDGNIKEPNEWKDSNKDWVVDLEKPVIENIVTSENTQGEVNLSLTTRDNKELAYVRVDACYSDIANPNTIGDGYTMVDCDDFTLDGIDIEEDSSLLGEAIELNTDEYTDSISINLNTNDEGAITFWITAMDKAGNYVQGTQHYRLGQWAVVENGLIYGEQGVHSSTRNLENDAWDDSNSEIANTNKYGFEDDTLDLTDQVLLGGGSISTIFLRELVKTNINNSFKVSNYPGASINLAYAELMNAFSKKREDINIAVSNETTLSTTLSEECNINTEDYCVIESDSDISIQSGFVCDGKGLIVSKGNITIHPDMTNLDSSSSNACILLAGGDINIGSGQSKSGDLVNYDIIQAFMIANNQINISEDGSNNGLIVEGALTAFEDTDNTSVSNGREIPWGPRTIYPVIAVNNNSKYGLLSRVLFGSQIDIYKTEVGFKPY